MPSCIIGQCWHHAAHPARVVPSSASLAAVVDLCRSPGRMYLPATATFRGTTVIDRSERSISRLVDVQPVVNACVIIVRSFCCRHPIRAIFCLARRFSLRPMMTRGLVVRVCSRRSFYRAMLCIRGTSHGPVSVRPCPSVCHKSVFY